MKYRVCTLLNLMGLNRSGYYKWRVRKNYPNRYEKDRLALTNLLLEAHKKHPSYGYHRLAREVFDQTGWVFSDNLAHKCCKAAGIRSKARKGYNAAGEESNVFPNEVQGRWNASKPVEIVVSDMTMFKVGKKYWEWTILLDTFNNEILAHSVTDVPGSNKPYYDCLAVLNRLAGKKEEQKPQVVFHTDQGAVYSSKAFCQAHAQYNINGWMKEELYLDFHLDHAEDVPALLDQYVYFFNNLRRHAALGYKSPVQYRTELGFP